MKEMRTQNKIAWRSSVPKTVNTYSSVGTKLSKIVRQCPQLIIGGVSSVHAVPQSLYYPSLFLSCTLLLPIQYSLWLNCLIAVYLTQSCDFSSKLEKRICGLYAIEWMGKSVWLYLRHPTTLNRGDGASPCSDLWVQGSADATANKELCWIWCRLHATLATITV